MRRRSSRPDSEVVAKAKRRTFTAEYKRSILQEAEAVAARRGGIGALLRREGLYSSLLATWRRERADGILEALTHFLFLKIIAVQLLDRGPPCKPITWAKPAATAEFAIPGALAGLADMGVRENAAEVQAQSTGRRKPETTTPECAVDRRSA